MGEIVVKHFKRASASSDAKVLVTEIVVESSDTGRFLDRLEETRMMRPCFQTLDMRGRVAGECRPYAFNDRIHYLDDISFQMFERGLKESNGIYTVGTFEAIMSGVHTLQAQDDAREAAQRRREEVEQRRLERVRAAALERADMAGRADVPSEHDLDAELAGNPPVLPLGYYRKRQYPRMQFACPVSLESGNIKTAATTRDISVSGIQVRIKGLTTFRKGQELLLSFTGQLPVETAKNSLVRIPYRIVSSEEREIETVLNLVRVDVRQPPGVSTVIEALIDSCQRKYKLDVEDEYQSVLSWYYERCYAQSATCIPFFVEESVESGLKVRSVAISEGNAHLARFFCTDEDNYNFTPVCLPARLQRLEQQKSFLLAMYRDRGERDQSNRIHSAADFECASLAAFADFSRHALTYPEHCVVKVHVSRIPAVSVPEQKLDEVSQRLQYKSEEKMVELRGLLKRLHLVGYLVDITQSIGAGPGAPGDNVPDAEMAAWVGGERRRISDQAVLETLSIDPEFLRPELTRLGYVERRREDRYLAETSVVVKIGSETSSGTSRDISTRGMRIQCDKRLGARKGATVKVGLISLQQKKAATNLMDIAYRVIDAKDEEDGTLLMLERILGSAQEGLKEFFVELITKNQHKLGVDIHDIWGATSSRIYEALLAINTPTIPLFLAHNADGGAHLQYVGVPESGNPLIDFFRVTGGYDFCCLNERRVVGALHDAVQILSRQSRGTGQRPTPFEIELYVYKEYDAVVKETFIHAATELDFPDPAARRTFLERLPGYDDWRCIKIVATSIDHLDQKVLDKMTDLVRTHSKHRALKLAALAQSVVGYAELVDISPEWLTLRSLNPVG